MKIQHRERTSFPRAVVVLTEAVALSREVQDMKATFQIRTTIVFILRALCFC